MVRYIYMCLGGLFNISLIKGNAHNYLKCSKRRKRGKIRKAYALILSVVNIVMQY